MEIPNYFWMIIIAVPVGMGCFILYYIGVLVKKMGFTVDEVTEVVKNSNEIVAESAEIVKDAREIVNDVKVNIVKPLMVVGELIQQLSSIVGVVTGFMKKGEN